MTSDAPVVLFHYPRSPFSYRVLSYLALRGIPYDQCIQPQILPRPDLARLGIRYRRIPLLSIGRDVYLDSPLILERLERLKVGKPSFASQASPDQQGLERLLASYTLDTSFFMNIVKVLLPTTPLIRNEDFLKDRADMAGGGPSMNFADVVQATRPDAIVAVKNAIEFLETTLLVDGREWLAKTDAPGRGDVETAWALSWLFSTPGAVPEEHISPQLFPKVFAWVERFQKAVAAAQKSLPTITTLSGEQVADLLGKAASDHTSDVIEADDPLVQANGFQVWPIDSGSRHKTVGQLVGLTSQEITIETTEGEVAVRVHAPRKGFRVSAAAPDKANLS
ncbi:hypothetical protein BJX68DRAFT_257564 [Aspergillus pseudodeflectus]|uniref:GST N-terminal domain-containing protein n=1 Tax=Aspergillus pseudodeflectus TaxID=176178 RepID=A0ABR4JSI2_9EURO